MKKLFVVIGLLSLSAAVTAYVPKWTQILPSETVALRNAQSLSVSPEGLLYIADTGNHRIIAVDSNGKVAAETGGLGSAHGKFQWPRVVVANRGNAIWVLDYGNKRIEKFSRSLAYQGTLEIRDNREDAPHQAEALAVSPQGDLFVFDKDRNRLIRYDPLLKPQSDFGGGSGDQFVNTISAMTFISKAGLFWWGRGGSQISRADVLLTPSVPLRLPDSVDNFFLADADTCLIYGYSQTIFRQCAWNTASDTLVDYRDLRDRGIIRIGACAVDGGVIYLLDQGNDAVYRLSGFQP